MAFTSAEDGQKTAATGGDSSRRRFWQVAFLAEGSLILLALLLGWMGNSPPLEHLPPVIQLGSWMVSLGIGVAASSPLIALLLIVLWYPEGPWRNLVRFVKQEVVVLFRGGTLWQFAAVSLLAGFGEELLFRGVIQDCFCNWLGVFGGIVATALLFGLCHWLTPSYALFAGLIGLYLGVLQSWSGRNLLIPIFAHTAYDFLALIILVNLRKTA